MDLTDFFVVEWNRKRLRDTMVAMIVTYEDAMKTVSNEVRKSSGE